MKEKIKALLIGIRYAEGSGHLYGCHNDVVNIYNYLNTIYKDSNYEIEYTILADTDTKLCGDIECLWPSRENILNSLRGLKDSGCKNYFIHYSGHGSSQTDWSGDEDDWKDEVLCPYDYSSAGCIQDDVLNAEFLQHLSSDCFVRILMDCCRSGTVWDLKYRYGNGAVDENAGAPNISCNVVALSGCKDNQYSYDVYTAGQSQGAFTHCFLKSVNSLSNNSDVTIEKLILDINEKLISGGWGGQTSRLTTSFKINNKDIFLSFKKSNEGEVIESLNVNEQTSTEDVNIWSILGLCTIS